MCVIWVAAVSAVRSDAGSISVLTDGCGNALVLAQLFPAIGRYYPTKRLTFNSYI